MSATSPKVRVTLRWLQILDKLDPSWKETGEFVFRGRVLTGGSPGRVQETRMPEQGHWKVSDDPQYNRLNKLDRVLFEGEVVGNILVVELMGEELDQLGSNDFLVPYKRIFTGDPKDFAGRYQPGDEGASPDPENMENWRVCYDIEIVD
jgi:hypothetical protein